MTVNFGDGTTIASGGALGKVLQVQNSMLKTSNSLSISGNTFRDIGLSVNITPSASSSKILIWYSVHTHGPSGYRSAQIIFRNSTQIGRADTQGNRARVTTSQGNIQSDGSHMTNLGMTILDEPNTTSQITYKIQGHVESNGTMYINRAATTGNNFSQYRPVSAISVMEIGA